MYKKKDGKPVIVVEREVARREQAVDNVND